MKKESKLRYSFATYKQGKDKDPICDVDELAELLAKGPKYIPEKINLTKATELYLLGRYVKTLKNIIDDLEKEKNGI